MELELGYGGNKNKKYFLGLAQLKHIHLGHNSHLTVLVRGLL